MRTDLRLARVLLTGILAVMLLLIGSLPGAAVTFTSSMPVLITSAGQSPDAFVVKVLFDRSKIASDYDEMVTADNIKGVKTLVLVLGGSAKGLGAAGIDEDEELARIKGLIDWAKKQKAAVIGVHIGGDSRRGPLSAKFIEVSAPRCDYLVIKEDGNADGYFTKLGIPMTLIKDSNEVGATFKAVFGLK